MGHTEYVNDMKKIVGIIKIIKSTKALNHGIFMLLKVVFLSLEVLFLRNQNK